MQYTISLAHDFYIKRRDGAKVEIGEDIALVIYAQGPGFNPKLKKGKETSKMAVRVKANARHLNLIFRDHASEPIPARFPLTYTHATHAHTHTHTIIIIHK